MSLDNRDGLPPEPPVDGRSTAVWRQWLYSMAKDPEAALAAAIAYREMDSSGRERWLASLAFDAPEVDVPTIALYAPLLAVEDDEDRRERLILAMGEEQELARPIAGKKALVGDAPFGTRVFVLASPLYFRFCAGLGLWGPGRSICLGATRSHRKSGRGTGDGRRARIRSS